MYTKIDNPTASIESLTYKESRSKIYENNIPTDSSKVNQKTKLDNLNLNWTEKELRERDRTKHVHRLHPYLGKFIPQLVEALLGRFVPAGGRVLDPFAGSGTTLVQ